MTVSSLSVSGFSAFLFLCVAFLYLPFLRVTSLFCRSHLSFLFLFSVCLPSHHTLTARDIHSTHDHINHRPTPAEHPLRRPYPASRACRVYMPHGAPVECPAHGFTSFLSIQYPI
ncbi:hypothetical protein C8R45DRAFT_297474 [Mycena sanguinolenta]|nr:hypothetical protein C8R45DRAFT_297474 [Mycena sanguinolenta]